MLTASELLTQSDIKRVCSSAWGGSETLQLFSYIINETVLKTVLNLMGLCELLVSLSGELTQSRLGWMEAHLCWPPWLSWLVDTRSAGRCERGERGRTPASRPAGRGRLGPQRGSASWEGERTCLMFIHLKLNKKGREWDAKPTTHTFMQ